MGKIGDLWVRLGLKADDFKKGMKKAGDSISSLLGKLKGMRIAGYDAFTYIGKAVGTFARNAIQMTQKWGDAWNNTMSGVKAAYGTFVRQLSSGDGWDNLFANMRESYRLAKELANSLDELFERKTSFSYTEAVTEKEIAELDLIRRDASKSDEERKKAADLIMEKTKTIGKLKKDIAQQEADDMRALFRDQTKMNDSEIDFLVRNYNENRDIITQARKYLDDRKAAQKASGQAYAASMTSDLDGVAADLIEGNLNRANDAVAELDNTTSQAVKDVAKVLQNYDRGSDELVSNMARAEVAVIKVDAEVARASARATATLGSLNKATAGSGSVSSQKKDPWEEYVQGIQNAAREAAAEAAEIADAQAEIDAQFDQFTEDFRELKGLTAEKEASNWFKDFAEGFADAAEEAAEQEQRMVEIAKEFNEAVVEGFADGCQEIMDSIMGLQEFNAGSVLQALLTPLADMAIQEGKILVASGLGIEAIKKALESLNGVAAMAAGAALIAVGTAAKAGLSALAQNGASSTSTTTAAATGGGSWQQNIQTEMTIFVTGKISGNDIEISGQRTVNNWSR